MKGGWTSGGSGASGEVASLQDLLHHKDREVTALAQRAAFNVQEQQQLKLPVMQLLNNLIAERAGVPDKDPRLSQLDLTIIPLTQLVRNIYGSGPYEVAHDSAPAPPSPEQHPTATGHMLQDLTEANLMNEASAFLRVHHLSEATGPIEWPVTGELYGPARRPLVSLPVALGNRPYRNIIFLVDTGAPITELSPNAFHALGADEATPPGAHAKINGKRMQVYLCSPSGNHPDIPVLGADGMAALGLELRVNYVSGVVTLTKGDGAEA